METGLILDLLTRHPEYVQLFGVGLVWISLHCAGMCGPIVIGLDLGDHLRAASSTSPARPARVAHASAHLAVYQLGRSLTYAAFGALAGWFGAALQAWLANVARVTGLLAALLILAYGLLRLFGGAGLESLGGEKTGRLLGRIARRLQRVPGLRRKFFLGVVLGFLPCMITFWALGLAASTQSPLHGAILMVLLVGMTSLVIFGIGLAPALLPAKAARFRERLLSAFLVFSGVWLGLISAASNGWIEHASVGFSVAGRGFAIMFW